MAVITCPRCGGSGEDPKTGMACGFCDGAKKVGIDDQELAGYLEEREESQSLTV